MNKKQICYYMIPFLGTLVCLWYIKSATSNIVYSDYIRLVNSYLPDVFNPARFFVPDVLTRIPIHYLGRIINVTFFDYSTTFDMILGVLGLGLSGFVLARYCIRSKLGYGWYLLLMFILFGLNKWEMLINGTGWGHFLAFAFFYYHYIVIDRVVNRTGKKRDRAVLLLLPLFITLCLAGPYCAVYSATVVVFYTAIAGYQIVKLYRDNENRSLTGFNNLTEQIRFWIYGCISVMIPLFLYLWSNSYAVEDHAGTYDISLRAAAAANPGFSPRFLLKAFASMLFGGEILTDEWLKHGLITDGTVYLMGLIIIAGYVLALYLNWRYRLYRKTILPLLLLISGLGNHAIILLSRYIFLKENYGMSSRYALQYQVGILGIILTLGILWKKMRLFWSRILAAAFCACLLLSHGYTNYREWKKAPYREEYVDNIAALALRFEEASDEELREAFEYRPSEPDSGAKIRQALTILKEQRWNVFSRGQTEEEMK